MARYLLILNDAPYGSERSYNGLRLADSLAKRGSHEVRVFLMGDAVMCAKLGQHTPNGYYNIERMLLPVTRAGGQIGVCGSCLDARGIEAGMLAEGAHRGSMDELTAWTEWAEQVLVF
jgi:uncharacterized protein involved in oxidation of intracellular sulfur